MKLDSIHPRHLRYRTHFKTYVMLFILSTSIISTYGVLNFDNPNYLKLFNENQLEIILIAFFLVSFAFFCIRWIRPKLNRYIQVYPEYLIIFRGKHKERVNFADIESVNFVCWSIFYVKLKDGTKYYFHSRYERVDYIWEGIFQFRPDLMTFEVFNNFRIKLVQYDHYQKRKEWFFKHKIADVINWIILPVMFLFVSFMFQSRDVLIHQQGIYFFRLLMYSMLVLLLTSFFYTIILKNFIFDKRVSSQLENFENKTRDLEFEGVVLQRSKMFQILTATFVLAIVIKVDLNLYSVTRLSHDIKNFKFKKGNTIIIDNRYNCINCKYRLNDGDYIIFGKGVIGQILAKEGELVGESRLDYKGRTVASENIQEVPINHVAVKPANGRDIVFVNIQELIGKIQN